MLCACRIDTQCLYSGNSGCKSKTGQKETYINRWTKEKDFDKEITISFSDEKIYENVQKYVIDSIEAGDETFYDSLETAFDTYGSKLERELEAKQALKTEQR